MNVLTYYNIMHGGFLITFVQHAQPIHYLLEVQANPKKNCSIDEQVYAKILSIYNFLTNDIIIHWSPVL